MHETSENSGNSSGRTPTGRAAGNEWLSSEEYTKYREFLQKLELEAGDQFDKVLISLSGGALGLSMTFVNQIAPQKVFIGFLAAAWLLFSLALLLTLLSFRTSHRAMRRQVDILDEVWTSGKDFEEFENREDRRTDRLNRWALWSFGLGVICLITFVFLNFVK